MSCDTNKFVISKGSDNTFFFTIKQDNVTIPLTIEGTDTFFADLVLITSEGGTPYTAVTNKELTVVDSLSGKISLVITSSETDDGSNIEGNFLVRESGSKADRYYLRPTYKLTLRCSTAGNGDFIVKVPEVYVD